LNAHSLRRAAACGADGAACLFAGGGKGGCPSWGRRSLSRLDYGRVGQGLWGRGEALPCPALCGVGMWQTGTQADSVLELMQHGGERVGIDQLSAVLVWYNAQKL